MIPTGLHDNIIYQVSRIDRFFSNELSRRFRSKGKDITSEQFSILVLLFYQENISQQEMADQLERDKTTISRVVQGMLKKDLIQWNENPEDRRQKRISLTEKGRNIQTELVQVSGTLYEEVLQEIYTRDLTIALKVIQQLITNILKS